MMSISEPDVVEGNFRYLKRSIDQQIMDYKSHGTGHKPVLFIRCEKLVMYLQLLLIDLKNMLLYLIL